MPFLSALGTSNYLWFNAMFATIFWIAAVIGINSLPFGEYSHYVVRGLAFAFATLIAFTAVNGTWVNPYRQAPLNDDTVSITNSGPLSGLQVDSSTAIFLREIQSAVQATKGTHSPYLVGWAGVPGAAVAGSLIQPLFAWITGDVSAALVLKASCQDEGRGILLLKFPGNPEPPAGGLPSQCSNRTWVKYKGIDVPSSLRMVAPQLEMYFAPPIT
jgi:hypothetical protein